MFNYRLAALQSTWDAHGLSVGGVRRWSEWCAAICSFNEGLMCLDRTPRQIGCLTTTSTAHFWNMSRPWEWLYSCPCTLACLFRNSQFSLDALQAYGAQQEASHRKLNQQLQRSEERRLVKPSFWLPKSVQLPRAPHTLKQFFLIRKFDMPFLPF